MTEKDREKERNIYIDREIERDRKGGSDSDRERWLAQKKRNSSKSSQL